MSRVDVFESVWVRTEPEAFPTYVDSTLKFSYKKIAFIHESSELFATKL